MFHTSRLIKSQKYRISEKPCDKIVNGWKCTLKVWEKFQEYLNENTGVIFRIFYLSDVLRIQVNCSYLHHSIKRWSIQYSDMFYKGNISKTTKMSLMKIDRGSVKSAWYLWLTCYPKTFIVRVIYFFCKFQNSGTSILKNCFYF